MSGSEDELSEDEFEESADDQKFSERYKVTVGKEFSIFARNNVIP